MTHPFSFFPSITFLVENKDQLFTSFLAMSTLMKGNEKSNLIKKKLYIYNVYLFTVIETTDF